MYKDTLSHYHKEFPLGEGAFGIVWKAIDTRTGKHVAIKRIRLDSHEEGVPATTIREIALLKELTHPNVVRLVDVVHGEGELSLVFEYLEFDLKKKLDSVAGLLDVPTLKV